MRKDIKLSHFHLHSAQGILTIETNNCAYITGDSEKSRFTQSLHHAKVTKIKRL